MEMAEGPGVFRQQAGGQQKPVVLEGKLQSPKLLAAVHGSSAPETTAAISALGGAIQRLQQQLSSAFGGRYCAVSDRQDSASRSTHARRP